LDGHASAERLINRIQEEVEIGDLRDCHKISVSIFLQNRYSGANG
jgi:hypothetical protein